jgi:hypothetical protein
LERNGHERKFGKVNVKEKKTETRKMGRKSSKSETKKQNEMFSEIFSGFMANVMKMLLSLRWQQTFPQKLFVFSEFLLIKRMTFMSKFTKLHSYVLCFLIQGHVNFANVLWVAFSIPLDSVTRLRTPMVISYFTLWFLNFVL